MRAELVRSDSTGAMLVAGARFLERHAGSEVLVVAATRSAADELVRGAAPAGCLGVHRVTLNQLAASLATAALGGHKLAPLTRLGTEALAARVAHMVRRDGDLVYFAPVGDTPGFPRALAATISELRQQCVDLVELIATGAPGADLARLTARYNEQLESGGLADIATTYALAAVEAEAGLHGDLRKPILFLDVPLRTALAERLVAAIAAHSPDALAVLVAGDQESAQAYERALRVSARLDPSPDPVDALGCLRRFLFSNERPAESRQDASLEIFSAAGEGLECVEIARRIHALAETGIAFDRTAVLLRSPERHQPLVEEALARAGIPAYFSRGAIRPDPAGRAFLALLACASEGCTATRFAEYLSLAQVPPLNEHGAPVRQEAAWAASSDEFLETFAPEGEPLPDPQPEPTFEAPIGWERLLVDAAVVGGTARWARRLVGLEAEIAVQIPEADPERQPVLEQRLHQLRRLQRFALPLIDLLAGLPRQARWGEWIERLTELAQTALKAPESVMGVLNELKPMGDVGPADLDEVYGVLVERLRFLRRDPPSRRYGRVFVGSLDEARGRLFDAVFVPGLAEGLFPRRAYEDPLLLDSYREALESWLPRQDTRFARERLLLHSAVAAASRRMIVSYPRMDVGQSRPRVPSFYALEVVRAAEGALPGIRDFERRAASAAPTRLGWPAPSDAKQAIDNAEYDLAVLEAAQRAPNESRGIGRYMVDANPALARSLRARWRRWHRNWHAADGLLAEPDSAALRLLHEHKLGARSYSPTALQQYSACPYRFYLYAIAQLRPREESVPLEQMDPLTRGGLFHSVLFKLFGELESRGLLPLTEGGQQEVLAVADQTLDVVASRYREDLAPAIPRVWETEVEDLRTDLRGWVRHAIVPGSEWKPHRFELAFGIVHDKGERDPTSSPDAVTVAGGVLLRGSVDLVERSIRRNVLRVVDHKTGRPPHAEIGYVGGGAVLQPLLYSLAVEQLLGEPVEAGMLSYCTQRGGYQDVRIDASPVARQRVEQALGLVGKGIEDGFLPAAPNTGACQYCDYTPVCGPYEEQRVRRKQPSRLEPLFELRKMP